MQHNQSITPMTRTRLKPARLDRKRYKVKARSSHKLVRAMKERELFQ